MGLRIYKCRMCDASLSFDTGTTTAKCQYCLTIQTIPKLDDERRANLYERANNLWRNDEYDRAMGVYETILQDDRADAEAYWSLVLCRYGIRYVEDPATGKRMPTMNRAQIASVLADADYKSALKYADAAQRQIYEREAREIDRIQKDILSVSQNEAPFDVFICYKDTDSAGRRTRDSVLAGDIYRELTREGLKVFYSRVTLEDKIG